MKRAVIIGATSGIGHELALQMAAAGWTVGTTGRREAAGMRHAAFDITRPDAVEHLARFVDELGGVDTVVYCAGTGDLNPASDLRNKKIIADNQ